MKKLLSIFVISIALLFSTLTKADVIQSVCNGCFTADQYRQRVITLIDSNGIGARPKTIYIFNYKLGVLKKYSGSSQYIDSGPGPGGAIPLVLLGDKEYFVLRLDISSNQLQRFNNSVSSYSALKSAISDDVVPHNVVDSAYSLVGAGYKENDLTDYYNSNLTIIDRIGNLIASAVAVTGKLPNLNIIVKVRFTDGSSATLSVTGLDKGATLKLKFLEGEDIDNNSITNNSDDYMSGTYRFTEQGEEGINRFLEAAARAGVPIYNGGSSGSTGTLMTCSSVGSDTICIITRDPT